MARPTDRPDGAGRGTPARAARARLRARPPEDADLEVRIRLAAAGDDEALRRLRRQADETHARLLPDYFRVPEGERDVGWPADRFSVTFVAETPDGVHGYVSARIVETPRDPTMTPRRRAHVDTVVVDARHRGRGLGTALMGEVGRWARGREAAELVLTVWSDNRAAEALYRGLGYQPIARVLRLPTDTDGS